ncbi:hypothetical protein [Streptomyces virginiae]
MPQGTLDLYGHFLKCAAHEAVTALATALGQKAGTHHIPASALGFAA